MSTADNPIPVHEIVLGLLCGFVRNSGLSEVDLCGANLSEVDLSGADLRWADLRKANLCGANLRGAILREADLSGAILRGADLHGADLRMADLRGVDLRGARGLDLPPAELAAERIAAVAESALANESSLNMLTWHSCETSHCLAGWAIHLAGDEGARLEAEYGPQVAGLLLLGAEAHAHFFDNDADARAWLHSKKKPAHG